MAQLSKHRGLSQPLQRSCSQGLNQRGDALIIEDQPVHDDLGIDDNRWRWAGKGFARLWHGLGGSQKGSEHTPLLMTRPIRALRSLSFEVLRGSLCSKVNPVYNHRLFGGPVLRVFTQIHAADSSREFISRIRVANFAASASQHWCR
ncbi:hypothetical protein ACVBEH_05840 [Roseateles sp. GG27B]